VSFSQDNLKGRSADEGNQFSVGSAMKRPPFGIPRLSPRGPFAEKSENDCRKIRRNRKMRGGGGRRREGNQLRGAALTS